MYTVDTRSPTVRLPVRAWNGLWRTFRQQEHASPSFSAEALMASARRRTGLNDFGDDGFLKPLGQLVESLNRSCGLHHFGCFLSREILTGLLCNRLHVERVSTRDPARPRNDDAPLVILGLPRTGSTLLFEILACDPGHRTLANWEATQPAPSPTLFGSTKALRKLRSLVQLRLQDYLTPELRHIHRSRMAGPEESTTLLMAEFTSQAFAAPFDVPEYIHWLANSDYTSSIAYHQRQLGCLALPGDSRRWLLKSPNYLPTLPTLLQAYPRATVLMTHRDPAKAIPSTCSLISAFRNLLYASTDPNRIAVQALQLVDRGLETALAERARHRDRWIDVHFSDLIADPLSSVRSIYKRLRMPLSAEIESRMLARASHAGEAIHTYAPAQFGLRGYDLRQRSAEYMERFGVRPEPL